MEVVRLVHGGVPCVLPAAQAVAASSAPSEDLPPVQLWPDAGAADERTGAGSPRFLHVQTSNGPRSLPCTDAHTAVIADDAVVELPPLLHGILRMPWVVAVAQLGDDVFWVLDARAIVQDRGEP